MALGLKDKGYQKIRIFEKTGRHGGKSYDTMIDGIYRPQGTLFMNADYVDNAIALAKRYNVGDMKTVDPPGVSNYVKPLSFNQGYYFITQHNTNCFNVSKNIHF